MLETILIIIIFIILIYWSLGFLFWITPCNVGGYCICGFEEFNFLFIFFWLPAMFSKKIMEVLEK